MDKCKANTWSTIANVVYWEVYLYAKVKHNTKQKALFLFYCEQECWPVYTFPVLKATSIVAIIQALDRNDQSIDILVQCWWPGMIGTKSRENWDLVIMLVVILKQLDQFICWLHYTSVERAVEWLTRHCGSYNHLQFTEPGDSQEQSGTCKNNPRVAG